VSDSESESDSSRMRMSFDLPAGKPEAGEFTGERPRPAPFHALALAHFGGTAPAADPVPVTREDFDAVLAVRQVRLDLEVPNRLGGHPKTLAMRLEPASLADLAPAGLIRQVPTLARLHALWRAVAAPGAGLQTPAVGEALAACAGDEVLEDAVARCRAALAPRPEAGRPAPDEGGSGALDRLLGMVGTGPTAASTGDAPPAGAAPSGPATDLEARLSDQVGAILHDPAFRAVEAAWRGLRLALWASDPRGGVRVWLLDLGPEAWPEALADGGPAARLHDGPEGPLALVVADTLAGPGTPDLDGLQALAEGAEGLQVPLVAGLAADFFGTPGYQADRLPFLGTVLDEPAYAPWRALRDKDAARWLVAAYNRPLLRSPYGPEDRGAAGLAEAASDPDDHLWGSPAWAVGALAAAAFDRDGWGAGLTGTDGLSDRPLWTAPGGTAQIPLEAALPDKVLRDMADAGVAPLACRPNRDSLFAPRAPMVHRPDTYDDPGATEAARDMARLSYQLVAARVTAALARYLARIPDGTPAAEAARGVEGFLADLLATTGPGAAVTVTAADGALDIAARTGRYVLGGGAVRLRLPWGVSS
jgi:predicted component of type VI protein secretion system